MNWSLRHRLTQSFKSKHKIKNKKSQQNIGFKGCCWKDYKNPPNSFPLKRERSICLQPCPCCCFSFHSILCGHCKTDCPWTSTRPVLHDFRCINTPRENWATVTPRFPTDNYKHYIILYTGIWWAEQHSLLKHIPQCTLTTKHKIN